MHFDHERIPERVVHARGAAAHGQFQLTTSLEDITCAEFLCNTRQPTPVFVRFSTVAGSRGSADTARDVRGFATKFYTSEGNFDLVGNNIPVFFIQDGIKFPDMIHAAKPEPDREIPQAQTAHDSFWDFVGLTPESTHMLMWAMSDRAIPRSFRTMEGFGVHTFRLVNAKGKTSLVKFHWKPAAGVHSLVWEESQKLGGIDPDFHRRDLWNSIEAGAFPEWEFGVQVMPDSDDQFFHGIDLLDPTKIVPEELCPVQTRRNAHPRSQPGELLRRDRAGRVLRRELRARYRADRRPAPPCSAVLVPRHADHPPRRTQLRADPDQPAARGGERQPPRRLRATGDPHRPGAVRAELDRRWVPVRLGDRRQLRTRATTGGRDQGAGARRRRSTTISVRRRSSGTA